MRRTRWQRFAFREWKRKCYGDYISDDGKYTISIAREMDTRIIAGYGVYATYSLQPPHFLRTGGHYGTLNEAKAAVEDIEAGRKGMYDIIARRGAVQRQRWKLNRTSVPESEIMRMWRNWQSRVA